MCSCICLIVKTHIVCITDYLLCLQVHLIYIHTYSMMYCVYVRTCVCVCCSSEYIRTYTMQEHLIVCLCVQSRDCECSAMLHVPYNSVVRTLFADVIFTSLLDILSEEMGPWRWSNCGASEDMVAHMTAAPLASSGSEVCSEVLVCTYVRTYLLAHPYFACLLSELHSVTRVYSHSTHTYLRMYMFVYSHCKALQLTSMPYFFH